MVKNKTRRITESILKIIISALALYFVFTKIDFSDVKTTLFTAEPIFLFFAWIFFVISKVISAIRLNIFLRAVGIFLSHVANLKLYLLGMFYNLFLPGGIGGDGYKVFLLNRAFDVKVKKLLWVVLLDRIAGMAVLGILVLGLGVFIKELGNLKYLSLLACLVACVILYFVTKLFLKEFLRIFSRVVFQSFLVQVFQIISVTFILMAFETYSNYLEYITIFLISSVVAILPITIGWAGARELTFLYGAKFLTLNPAVSVTLSLTFYLITALTSLIGFMYVLKTPELISHPMRNTPVPD